MVVLMILYELAYDVSNLNDSLGALKETENLLP